MARFDGMRLRINSGVVGASLLDEGCDLLVAAAQEDPRLVRRVGRAVGVYENILIFFRSMRAKHREMRSAAAAAGSSYVQVS